MTTRLRNAVTLVAIGTFCWVIAGVIAIGDIADAKIIWTFIVVALLGFFGSLYTIRRERRSGL